MTDNRQRSSGASGAGDASQPDNDPSLEALRHILLSRYLKRLSDLEAELDDLERRITDEDALIATISPVMGDAIRRRIRNARREMVEALYPIIGQVVVRAVSEAIRDLARTVDAQVRTSFSPRVLWWRLRARIGGASGAETSLRGLLPFEVAEIFLIHRETGLLLRHISREPEPSPDSDLISSMLTAIRDFAQDAFGQGREAQLDEIEYGERRILIEAAQHAYLAVVVDGVEPPGFRAAMREQIIEVEHAHEKALRHYDGDPAPLAAVEKPLRSLMGASSPRGLSPVQKRVLAGALGLMFVCVVMACMAGRWAVQTMRRVPTATALPTATQAPPTAAPSATPTAAPSATPSPTLTTTPSPTLTPTFTATPTPAPVVGVMTGHVWVRQDPSADAPFLGLILERGQPVEVLAAVGDWCRVLWTPQAQSEVTGWVPLRWVGTMAPIPARVITPASGP